MLERRAGTSGRFPVTGMRKTMPGRSTVSLAKGITGRVAALIGAIVDVQYGGSCASTSSNLNAVSRFRILLRSKCGGGLVVD